MRDTRISIWIEIFKEIANLLRKSYTYIKNKTSSKK